jgi:hypothetical protein
MRPSPGRPTSTVVHLSSRPAGAGRRQQGHEMVRARMSSLDVRRPLAICDKGGIITALYRVGEPSLEVDSAPFGRRAVEAWREVTEGMHCSPRPTRSYPFHHGATGAGRVSGGLRTKRSHGMFRAFAHWISFPLQPGWPRYPHAFRHTKG